MWRRLALGLAAGLPLWSAGAIVLDRTHESRVFHETRHYRILLPPAYESSSIRYPVIYWFHGYGERFDDKNEEMSIFVATHDVIVVKWDGSNGSSSRPYNVGPVETDRQFPLYFPELVSYIDANYRTIADREHRAISGFSMGGFMSFWIAGKYPDLVSSASSFMGSPEFVVGPREFPVEYSHDGMAGNYAGVRTRLVTGSQDFIQFYHRQMNRIWTMPTHETENFDSGHGVPGLAKTLAFHMEAFANPLPRPEAWSHIDLYPNFTVWGWTVETDRRQRGFTSVSGVSRAGFHSRVQEWLPGGKTLSYTHLKITTAPLYAINQPIPVITIRLRDNSIHRLEIPADSEGRLHMELDGNDYEVHIGSGLAQRSIETRSNSAGASAPVTTNFQIADHRAFEVFYHAIEKHSVALGEGNGDGKADHGEQIVILFPDGDAYRAAELFSADPCLDLTTRISDNWASYDYVGASAKFTVAKINCAPGRVVQLHARVLFPNKPNHQLREFAIEIPIGRIH